MISKRIKKQEVKFNQHVRVTLEKIGGFEFTIIGLANPTRILNFVLGVEPSNIAVLPSSVFLNMI